MREGARGEDPDAGMKLARKPRGDGKGDGNREGCHYISHNADRNVVATLAVAILRLPSSRLPSRRHPTPSTCTLHTGYGAACVSPSFQEPF